jgi:hypothetical protein
MGERLLQQLLAVPTDATMPAEHPNMLCLQAATALQQAWRVNEVLRAENKRLKGRVLVATPAPSERPTPSEASR